MKAPLETFPGRLLAINIIHIRCPIIINSCRFSIIINYRCTSNINHHCPSSSIINRLMIINSVKRSIFIIQASINISTNTVSSNVNSTNTVMKNRIPTHMVMFLWMFEG